MKMTNRRKTLQDKLRRKYGYHTNSNYGRGTVLEYEGPDSSICVVMDFNGHYNRNGRKEFNNACIMTTDMESATSTTFCLSYDELIMIGQIAEEMKKEHEELMSDRKL